MIPCRIITESNEEMKRRLRGYAVSVIVVAAITAVFAPFANEINSATISLALLLGVLVVATGFGSRPALLASLLAMLCFNFFFLPPLYTFTIAAPQNWIALSAFLITAIVAGQMSSYARRRTRESEERRREIERLYSELQDAFEQASEAEALRRSEKLKSALLDAVTHDLRTPLTSIKVSVTSLLEDRKAGRLDEEARSEFLEIIDEESDRLNKFIEGMVELARIEAKSLPVRRNWTSARDVIDESIDRAQQQLENSHVLIEIERDLPNMLVDAQSVSAVLYSLLDNAAKYSPAGSKIRIAARSIPNADSIQLSVENQGTPIPRDMREKVFDKFTRGKTTTTQGGLGLGLAIARGLVEYQGGDIWIEDGSNGYSTKVIVQLPIGDEEK